MAEDIQARIMFGGGGGGGGVLNIKYNGERYVPSPARSVKILQMVHRDLFHGVGTCIFCKNGHKLAAQRNAFGREKNMKSNLIFFGGGGGGGGGGWSSPAPSTG